MTPEELPRYLERMTEKLKAEGPTRAANAMASAYHRHLANDVLVRASHTRGSPTTSAPGSPPALVSGSLKRSLRQFPAIPTGAYRAKSKVSPLIIYARIQEKGGVIVAKHTYIDQHGHTRIGALSFVISGRRVFVGSVKIPARPYMKPARREVIANGELRRAAMKAIRGLVP